MKRTNLHELLNYLSTNCAMPFTDVFRMLMSSKENLAFHFAAGAHGGIGQLRKYSGEPYINHPVEVFNILRFIKASEQQKMVGLLHDVKEDTKVTTEHLRGLFGDHVTSMVLEVSDVSTSADGPRAVRKAMDREHYRNASPESKTVKLADLISNGLSIMDHDKEFALMYVPEMALLLEVLTEGDSRLWSIAHEIVIEATFQLAEYKRDKDQRITRFCFVGQFGRTRHVDSLYDIVLLCWKRESVGKRKVPDDLLHTAYEDYRTEVRSEPYVKDHHLLGYDLYRRKPGTEEFELVGFVNHPIYVQKETSWNTYLKKSQVEKNG